MSDFVDGNLLNLDTNHCKPDTQYVWCLPQDYNLEKHPFSCKIYADMILFVILSFILLPFCRVVRSIKKIFSM